MKKFLAKGLSVLMLIPLLTIAATGTASATTSVIPHLTGVTLVGKSISSNDLVFRVESDNWEAGDVAYIYSNPGYDPTHADYVKGLDTTNKNYVMLSAVMTSPMVDIPFGVKLNDGSYSNTSNWSTAVVIKNKDGDFYSYTVRDSSSIVWPLFTPTVSGTITNTYSKAKTEFTVSADSGAMVTLYSDSSATSVLTDAQGTKPAIAAVKADSSGLAKFKINLPSNAGSFYTKAVKGTKVSAIGYALYSAKPLATAPKQYDASVSETTYTTIGIKNLYSVDSVVYADNVKKDDTINIYITDTDTKTLVSKKATADGKMNITIPKAKMPAGGVAGTFYATISTALKDNSPKVPINFVAQASTDITNFVANSSIFAMNTPDSAKVTDVVYATSLNNVHIGATDMVKVYATNADALSGNTAKAILKGNGKATAVNGRYLELSKKGALNASTILNNTVYVTLTSPGYKESVPVAVSFGASPQYDVKPTAFTFISNTGAPTSKDIALVYALAPGDTVYVYDVATLDSQNNLVVDTVAKTGVRLLGKATVAKGQSEAIVSFVHATGNAYYVVKNDSTEYSYAVKLNK
jgi:hypothetical protein